MLKSIFFQQLFGCFDIIARGLLNCEHSPVVSAGPFKGMCYVTGAVGSSLVPKILGTYELEIADWISQLPRFSIGLDVGAAEGYYAVGLLKQGICDRIIGWEMNPEGRALMARLAAANQVENRLEIRGLCDSKELEDAISAQEGNVLVIIDCEGYEGTLVPALGKAAVRQCHFIIETHNPMNPGVHERLRQHLEITHEVVESFPKKRRPADMPSNLTGSLALFRLFGLNRLAMSERRCPDLGWLLCVPKSSGNP